MDSPTPFPNTGSTEFPWSSNNDVYNWSANWYLDFYDSWENISSFGHDNKLTHITRVMEIVTMAMYTIAILVGTTGNGFVIFLTAFRMKKTVTTVWYLNLAVADFIFSIYLLPEIMYKALNYHWFLGRLMCKLDTVVPFLNMFASVFFLTAISADRYVMMVHPVWALNHRTVQLTSFMALLIWGAAWILSSPYFDFRDIEAHLDGTIKCIYTHCSEDYGDQCPDWHRPMVLAEFLVGFLIPFIIILACYGALLIKLRRKLSGRFNRSFKVVVAVVVAFFTCWFPYHVFAILDALDGDQVERNTFHAVGAPLANILVCFNCCLNPILYAFVSPGYRRITWGSLLSSFKGAFDEKRATHSSSSTKNSSFTSGMEATKI